LCAVAALFERGLALAKPQKNILLRSAKSITHGARADFDDKGHFHRTGPKLGFKSDARAHGIHAGGSKDFLRCGLVGRSISDSEQNEAAKQGEMFHELTPDTMAGLSIWGNQVKLQGFLS
jgi:hypothetical protein